MSTEIALNDVFTNICIGGTERPSKRRRSSISTAAVSSPRPAQRAIVDKLKAELAAARSEIVSLKKSNNDLLDQQLDDDDDDDDIFGSPTRKATASKHTATGRPLLTATHSLSFLGNRPTRPTTPEPTENGSPEYDAPGEFDYSMNMNREMTPPSSSPPDANAPRHLQEQMVSEKSEMELKVGVSC
jgi:hypothetical protein